MRHTILTVVISTLLIAGCPGPVSIPEPVVASISKSEGVAGFVAVSTRIEGEGLADAVLSAGGGIRFANTAVTENAILTDIDLTSASPGNFVIVVTTPAGQAETPFAVVQQAVEQERVAPPGDFSSAALFLNPPAALPGFGPPSSAIQSIVDDLNGFWGVSVRVNTYTPGAPDGRGGVWPPNNAFAIAGPEQQIAYDPNWLATIEAQTGSALFTQLVIAHEVGHQVQYQLIGTQNLPRIGGHVELMADCFAGIYLAARGVSADQIAAAQAPLCGGTSVWVDPNSHGSCEERQTAARHGTSLVSTTGGATNEERIRTCVEVPPFGTSGTPTGTPQPPQNPLPPQTPDLPPQGQFQLGCIVVQNFQFFPVTILVDGFFVGTLAPGQSGPIGNLPLGQHQITSVAPNGAFIVVPVLLTSPQEVVCATAGV